MDAQSQDDKKWENFRQQIQEDLRHLQGRLNWNERMKSDSFAFNCWVLTNLYDENEDTVFDQITEYKDKGIDCFVHREESKDLFIIQNKYYGEDTRLDHKELSDFLTRPLATLEAGDYGRKSKDLQKAYNKAKKDSEYTIHLHMYVTNNATHQDLDNLITKTEMGDNVKVKLNFLKNIYGQYYYGESFKKKAKLKCILKTRNKSTYLAIRPNDYGLKGMRGTFFVMTPVTNIYNLWKLADKNEYPLFEENIRDYLGKTVSVNKRITSTLKDESEKRNFFYYNNGITITCNSAKAIRGSELEIKQPQIINGCQTVNSIVEVLDDDEAREENFGEVFVMTKILMVDDDEFSQNVVKYTNSQNSINEKTFAAGKEEFFKLQEKMEELGFFLIVKQSDKHTFGTRYKPRSKERVDQIGKAQEFLPNMELGIKKFTDMYIPLDHLLLCLGALSEGANFAYTKKPEILNPSSKSLIYSDFSMKIQERFTVEEMLKAVCLYKKSERDRRDKSDKTVSRFPLAYYLLNFFGRLLEKKATEDGLKLLRKLDSSGMREVYNFVQPLSELHYKRMKDKDDALELNLMLKNPVDKDVFEQVLDDELEGRRRHNKDGYETLMRILNPPERD